MKQNDIVDLPKIATTRYENIFNVFETKKDKNTTYYYYNIFDFSVLPSPS